MSARNVYCRLCGLLVDTHGLDHARRAYVRVVDGKQLVACPACAANPAVDWRKAASEKEMLEERREANS